MAQAEKGSLLPPNSSDVLTHSKNRTGLVGVRTHPQPRAHCDQEKEVLFWTSLVSWVTLRQRQGGRQGRQDSKLHSPTTATRSWGGVPKVTAKCSYYMKVDAKLNKRQLSTKSVPTNLKPKQWKSVGEILSTTACRVYETNPQQTRLLRIKRNKVIIKMQEKL